MGVPLFKIKRLLSEKKVNVLSSNYPLYADISFRAMQVLSSFLTSKKSILLMNAF